MPLPENNVTMLDIKSQLDPNGKPARIIEMLDKTNEILTDMVVKEGNRSPDGNRTTIRTGLPDVGWKTLYKGTQPSKSTTAQVDDASGILEAFSSIDEDAVGNDKLARVRLNESMAFLEAMNQTMASSLFYENSIAHPERPHGLAIRYNTLNPATPISENIIDAGGLAADALTSIWLICWSDWTIHGFYPMGHDSGLYHEDKGKEKMTGPENRIYYAYIDQYKWKIGFSVRDWRYGVRICNIPTNRLADVNLVDLMIEEVETIPSITMGRTAFYMNRPLRTALRKQIKDAKNMNLTLDTVAGRKVLFFDEVPVRRVDALVNIESRVTA